MRRTSTRMGVLPPTRSTSFSWLARSSFAWVSSGMSPTSSRKSVPPSAASNFPSRRAIAPVNAPRSWPKSSLSTSSWLRAAQFILTSGLARRGLRGAVGRDHDDRQVGVEAPGVLENLHAADAVHAEVGDDDVEAPGLDLPERLLAAGRRLDVVALLGEQPLQGEQHRLLVVDHEDAALHLSSSPAAAA